MKTGKLDEYAVKARVFPAFLALLPLALCVPQFVGFKSMLTVACSSLGALGGTALFSFVLAQWSRNAGKTKEKALFRTWGGMPTTAYLRHSNQSDAKLTKQRRRERLQRLTPDIVLPSVRAEADAPQQADECYEAATKVLIQRTRDKEKYQVLFQELIDYGFRRNTWGLKGTATAICVIAILFHAAAIALGYNTSYNATCAAFIIAALLLWIFAVTPGWVRQSGDVYAERLFDCLDQMTELDEQLQVGSSSPNPLQ